MKYLKKCNVISGFFTKKTPVFLVGSIVLSSLVTLPVLAQRGNDQREKQRSNDRKSEVRASRPGTGNRVQGISSNSNRNSSVNNAPNRSYQRDDHRSYEGRYDRYYGKWPARGVKVSVLPSGGYWRSYNGVRYMYHGGFYYRPYGKTYVVVAPPLGFRIASLPVGFVTFSIANAPYYYYAGTYYQRQSADYVVVQPPLGALVQSIPEGGQQVVIDGNTFFIVDGIQYQAIMFNGSIWYKVIKIENRVDNYSGNNPY